MPIRETWATRLGFILAAVGSAVGLGNIWRFPFLTGQSGGAAFLVVYLALVALVGLPVLLVEFVIGRRAERNIVGAFDVLGHPAWKVAGGVGALAGFIILSYYSVVGGWVLQYIVGSATGAYVGGPAVAEGFFGETATGMNAVAYHAVFMAMVAGIVAFGIRDGLERAAKLMVPSVFVLLIGLAAYGATLSGATEAYAYYLSPDFGALAANYGSILPAAAGQAFFTLSLGMGVMVTYASYLGEDRNILNDALTVVVLDTAVAFLAGLVVFPFLFTQNIEPGEGGVGAVFISLAGAFGQLPAGTLIGGVFFVMLAVAALTSAFSILEVVVAFATETFDLPRKPTAVGLAFVMFLIGIPTALNLTYLGLYDGFVNNILLILGGLLLSLFVGWVYARESLDEIRQGMPGGDAFANLWLNVVRVPIVLILLYTLYRGIVEYAGVVRGAF